MTVQIEGRGHSVLLGDVSWDYYTHTLKELGPSRNVRITFDAGRMEIVTTSNPYERVKVAIARLLETYALEADIPVTGDGSLTLRLLAEQKGLEPDECYYVHTSPPPASEEEFDLSLYPPPDLAIEVEVSRGSIPKQPIYAALGVPEVWRYDGQQVIPLHLTPDGRYEPASRSLAFPDLSMADFNTFLGQALQGSQHEAVKQFRDFIRASRP